MRWPAFCVACCLALPAALCRSLPAALLRRLLFCAAPLRCLVFCAGCPAGCFPMEFGSSALASNSSVTASTASSIFPMALRCSTPASNKPHPAEKSTPVWLAIWRIWAGFANSQLQRATFRSTYLYMCPSALLPPWSCCSDRRKSFGPSAPIAYATSVSPPNEAIAWPGAQVLGAG